MSKSSAKEIIIILLLCLAIILVLGILLYEYVPMSKTIPNQVAYTTPEDVKKELTSADSIDENQVIMTYEVDATDLNNYKRTQNYKPGKANPFSSFDNTKTTSGTNTVTNASSNGGTTTTTGTSNTTGTNNQTQQNNNTSSSKNDETTSGGRFFQNTGTK